VRTTTVRRIPDLPNSEDEDDADAPDDVHPVRGQVSVWRRRRGHPWWQDGVEQKIGIDIEGTAAVRTTTVRRIPDLPNSEDEDDADAPDDVPVKERSSLSQRSRASIPYVVKFRSGGGAEGIPGGKTGLNSVHSMVLELKATATVALRRRRRR
jgi:hypothetical protein